MGKGVGPRVLGPPPLPAALSLHKLAGPSAQPYLLQERGHPGFCCSQAHSPVPTPQLGVPPSQPQHLHVFTPNSRNEHLLAPRCSLDLVQRSTHPLWAAFWATPGKPAWSRAPVAEDGGPM